MNPNDRRQTFDDLIKQHLPLRPAKLRMLMELKESIAEARKKAHPTKSSVVTFAKRPLSFPLIPSPGFATKYWKNPKAKGPKEKGRRGIRAPMGLPPPIFSSKNVRPRWHRLAIKRRAARALLIPKVYDL